MTQYGIEREVFVVDQSKARVYEQLALDTPTGSHPRPLSSGEVAFVSRVNEYENKKGDFIYDVFLWSHGTSRRLTQANRYIHDYAISDSAKWVLLFTKVETAPQQCEMILWNVTEHISRNLKCEGLISELPLTP